MYGMGFTTKLYLQYPDRVTINPVPNVWEAPAHVDLPEPGRGR
jgi:hypothetical protein